MSLTPETWAQVRDEYEHTEKPVDDICLDHGISPSTLRVRRRG
jgi:transposase-like protein